MKSACHLREDLIHSRLDVSGTLLTSCVERADRQAGEDQSMQSAYFHKENGLGVDKEDRRNLMPVWWSVPPMTEERGLVAKSS
jgi:hypothetical protein